MQQWWQPAADSKLTTAKLVTGNNQLTTKQQQATVWQTADNSN
jgi:hypothetical protein